MRVVIAGGGTAGHVNPALALADALAGDDLLFIGTPAGAERDLAEKAGLPYATVDVRGFDRARPASLPGVALRAARALGEARRHLRGRADVVVGMGGYVSLPVCLAGARLRIPVVLHEQNIVLGLAHRVSRRWARRVAVSWRETLPAAGPGGVFTGNPVLPAVVAAARRRARVRARSRWGLAPRTPTVLIFGGSQGAARLNIAACGIAGLWRARTDVQLLHVSGRAGAGLAPVPPGAPYRRVDFADPMVDAYAAADVVVARGGATSIAELCVLGLPSVIVPYPHHRDRQQEKHGRVLADAGAALIVADSDATPERLAAAIETLFVDPKRRKAMADAARALAIPDAAARLADVVRSTAGEPAP